MTPPLPDAPQPVTMDDVAQAAGVSRATVSRVLAGTVPVNDDTRTRVLQAINRLGYVPNLVAQALATRRTTLVGLLLRNPRKPIYALLHAEIQDRAATLGLDVVTVAPSSLGGPDREQRALQLLLGLRVSGLLVATGVSHTSHLAPFLGVVPVVAVGRPEEHPKIHAISYDEDTTGQQVAAAVHRNGHHRIAVVVPDHEVSIPEHRRARAAADALSAAGAEVHRVAATRLGQAEDGAAEVLALVREQLVTCAVFPTDERALAFLELCDHTGVRVPQDVSVTGVDGAGPGLDRIGLATVQLPVAAAAEAAVDLMARLVDGEQVPVRHMRLAGEFRAAGSLAAPST